VKFGQQSCSANPTRALSDTHTGPTRESTGGRPPMPKYPDHVSRRRRNARAPEAAQQVMAAFQAWAAQVGAH